jgi:hypothetical protein
LQAVHAASGDLILRFKTLPVVSQGVFKFIVYYRVDPQIALHFKFTYNWPTGVVEPNTGPSAGGTTVIISLQDQLPLITSLEMVTIMLGGKPAGLMDIRMSSKEQLILVVQTPVATASSAGLVTGWVTFADSLKAQPRQFYFRYIFPVTTLSPTGVPVFAPVARVYTRTGWQIFMRCAPPCVGSLVPLCPLPPVLPFVLRAPSPSGGTPPLLFSCRSLVPPQ